MHIVFVSREYGNSSLRRGGIASYIKEVAISLLMNGHQVTVICASDDTRLESTENENGVNIIRLSGGDFVLPALESRFSTLKKFRVFYRFYSYRIKIKKKLLSLSNVDIVEVAEFGAEGFFLNKVKTPVVCRLHTPSLLDRSTAGFRKFSLKLLPEYWVGFHENYLIKHSKYITSCSNSLKNWCVKYLDISESLIKTIYNPVNLANWNYSHDFFSRTQNTVLFVGTVAESKGVQDLFEACKILRNEGNNIKLIIVGKMGSYGNSLKREVELNGIEWCSFLGQVERSELYQMYYENSICCLPSWWDNFPLVCLEAMAANSIVVGSRSGGMSEIITEGIDGFLVEPRSPELLAKKIKTVLELSQEEKNIIANNAKKTVEKRFSDHIIIDQMVDYYLKIINNGK